MSLTQTVSRLIAENSSEAEKKTKALRDAERLADMFADIRPQDTGMPIEKYFGTPVFKNEKSIY